MRFRTIWTLPAMSLRERLDRTRDWAAMTVAAHLPYRVRYWAWIQVTAKATAVDPNAIVGEVTVDELLRVVPLPKHDHLATKGKN